MVCCLCLIIGVVAVFAVLFLINLLISPKRLDLSNGHVLITGGSSGIGLSLAIQAVKRGASVTIVARRENVLRDAKQEIEKHIQNAEKQKVQCLPLDLTDDYPAVEREIKKAEKSLGPLDMLINCAGISISDKFENTTVDEFRRLIEVNYIGSVSATKAVIQGMKSRKRGRIVFVSSQAGQLGIFGFTAYSGSKFALRGMAEALVMETKAYDIYVTLAFPPDVDTPGYQAEIRDARKPKEAILISQTSGLFDPDTVAKAIMNDSQSGRFLSSVGLDGWMLSTLTAGMSPVTSVCDVLVQIFLKGIFRAISIFYLKSFDWIVQKCRKEAEQKNKQQ